jgi:hypothetical protein
VTGGFDRADANKNQSERSNKLCKARTKLIHAPMESDCSGGDK